MCPNCRDIIFSDNRCEIKVCKCGACTIKGGTDYLRYSWNSCVEKENILIVTRGELNIATGNGA